MLKNARVANVAESQYQQPSKYGRGPPNRGPQRGPPQRGGGGPNRGQGGGGGGGRPGGVQRAPVAFEDAMAYEEIDDRVACPFCGRKFGETQAERHIPHCKTKAKDIGRRMKY